MSSELFLVNNGPGEIVVELRKRRAVLPDAIVDTISVPAGSCRGVAVFFGQYIIATAENATADAENAAQRNLAATMAQRNLAATMAQRNLAAIQAENAAKLDEVRAERAAMRKARANV